MKLLKIIKRKLIPIRFVNLSNQIDFKILDLCDGLINGQRHCLAKAITLIESTRYDHKQQASQLLDLLSTRRKPNSKYTLRLGVAGPPGAGKSTFIEALGMNYVNQGHRVAVIPVDPTSHISGGSILGDKTRMDKLSLSDNAYVRASPTRGVLGGIAEHTFDIISLCESARYDVVIVESVGLGQSEVDIDMAVDMLVLIVPPGGGDSLQASKKGIMEVADLIIVNKADNELLNAAKHTKADYSGSIQFIRQKYIWWKTKVLLMSAKTGAGLDEVISNINEFHEIMINNGSLIKKRSSQSTYWMWNQLTRLLLTNIQNQKDIIIQSKLLINEINNGIRTPRSAAHILHNIYINTISPKEK